MNKTEEDISKDDTITNVDCHIKVENKYEKPSTSQIALEKQSLVLLSAVKALQLVSVLLTEV